VAPLVVPQAALNKVAAPARAALRIAATGLN